MDIKEKLLHLLAGKKIRPRLVFGLIIFGALLAFEIFNYSTTDYALRDLLGELRFANVRWATILAIAFCGIDFAGIARLFTPEQGSSEPREVWYLFGAWLLAATMNAMLTWWGVSMAITSHAVQSATIMESSTVFKVVPIFVAVMVWVIRILIIGTISSAADHLIWGSSRVDARNVRRSSPVVRPASQPASPVGAPVNAAGAQAVTRGAMTAPASRPVYSRPVVNHNPAPSSGGGGLVGRPEPTYHSMQSSPGNQANRQV